MSGRDAYFEMGFDTPKSEKPQNSAPVNADPAGHSYAALETTQDSGLTEHAIALPEPGDQREYLAGLFLVLAVLLIGMVAGFFGRGLFGGVDRADSELMILGTQPLPALESLAASANSDVVFVGSGASDQVLAIQASASGDALILAKSYHGAAPEEVSSQLLHYAASDDTEQGHALSQAKSLRGEGLHLLRVDNGALIAASLHNGNLKLSRVNESGRSAWTKSFATGAVDRSEVALASNGDGFVFLAPDETRDAAQLVSVNLSGHVNWQQQLDRPRIWQRSFVSVDPRGQTFAVLGTQDETQPLGSQNIVMVDASGNMLRQRLLSLNPNDTIAGIAARPDGGATFLVSGDAPHLIQLGASGQRIATIDLPYMRYLNEAHMLALDSGDLVIASTYALMGNRVDMVLEQRHPDGMVVGQRTIALPTGATLDALVSARDDEYLIAGSVRRGRYLPTDMFLQSVSFSPDPMQQFAATTPGAFTAAAMDPLPSAGLNQAVSVSTEDDALDLALATSETDGETVEETAELGAQDTIPTIASLTLAPTEITESDAPEVTAEPLTDEVIETDPAIADAEEAGTVADVEPEDVLETNLEAETTDSDLDAAAMSRFIEQSIVTQCRFTCVDPASGGTFPMTGHFLPALLATPANSTAIHTNVCRSADLAPVLESRPQCGFE